MYSYFENNPEKLKPITSLPEDFLNFWETAKLQAQKTPMDVQMTLVPERCTEKVNVFLHLVALKLRDIDLLL